MHGNKIKSLREKLGMSQLDLAKYLWATQPYISLMESDKAQPSEEKIYKLNKLADKHGIRIRFKILRSK